MNLVKRSFTEEMRAWKHCLEGFRKNSEEFPFLRNDLKAFEGLVARAIEEHSRLEQLRNELKKQEETFEAVRNTGRDMHLRLLGNAKALYGTDASKIREFINLGD